MSVKFPDLPKIPDSARFAILIPTFRWGGEVKSILASFLGVAGNDVVVLIADNSENKEKHAFLNDLGRLNKSILSFCHKKNIGATENFYFLHEWSKSVEFTAIMADDDAVSPTYYLDSYQALKDRVDASCASVGSSFADFGDHQYVDISQCSMVGQTPVERMRFWSGFSGRITTYDVCRRSSVDNALKYLKATPLHGLTLMEDLFELNRLSVGNFVRERGRGFFVHYPFHGAKDGDSINRFYNLLCRDVGLGRPMIHFMGLSTAIQCALFLLGGLSPIEDEEERYKAAQHVFKFLFFNGFHKELQQENFLLGLKHVLSDFPSYSARLDKYARTKIENLVFDGELLSWFVGIVGILQIKQKKSDKGISQKFIEFCNGLLDTYHIDDGGDEKHVSEGKIEFSVKRIDGLNLKYRKILSKDTGIQQIIKDRNPSEEIPKFIISKWLEQRAPSPARAEMIQSMIQANPDVGTLGVLVVCAEGQEDELLKATLDSLRAQVLALHTIWVASPRDFSSEESPEVQYLGKDSDWCELLLGKIKSGDCPDFIWILCPGDCLVEHASLQFGEYRLRFPDPLVWYADDAVLNNGQPDNPMLKPDFNLDLLRCYPYTGRNLILSTAAIEAVGGLADDLGELAVVDLTLRLVEKIGSQAVGHIPEVLLCSNKQLFSWISEPETSSLFKRVIQAHLDRIGSHARIISTEHAGQYRLQYPISGQPLVSIVIPTRDQLPVLQNCLDSLMEKTAYTHYEILIVDNGSTEPLAVEFLNRLGEMGLEQVRVLRWPQGFNYSAIGNFAAQNARGEVLLFLDNDIEISDSEWLTRLLGYAMRSEVGVVGARLDYPDGRVQHAGLVLGMDNRVGFAFQGEPGNRKGYMNRLITPQNVGAVSGSCLMIRKSVYQALGGFDAQDFPVFYGDADLCLRAAEAGYLVVQAADVSLKHMGGAARLLSENYAQDALPDREQGDRLYAKWLPRLVRDPAYHPSFGRLSPGFSLSFDAARLHEPLPGRPLPVVLASHVDWAGCGHYRIIHPYEALEAEGRLEGGLKRGHFHFTDIARVEPDVVVLQGAWANPGILDEIRRIRHTIGAKVVLEFDDYLPNLPTRHMGRNRVSTERVKLMRRAMEQSDWIVVSTATLAQEYADWHPQIRVAHNGLPVGIWGRLAGQRRTGQKLRVGWAGGSSHTGDLAEIRILCKNLEDEVHWVFMGMQPEGIKCEFHAGVEIAQYPQKLASLNLDLALVPLEVNQFNRCKSNLRLLELGACGVPIVCTDIEPYQCDLPVTRVQNRYQNWERAIRERMDQPDVLAREGDALQQAIRAHWMLEGRFLDQWMGAWSLESEKNSGQG